MAQHSQETVIGQITSVFGVKGWLKVYSYTDPKDGILNYRDWTLVHNGKRIPARLEEGRRQGQGIVVRLKGIDDREVARSYCGADVVVSTEELPQLPEGEYYWHQLEGLDVFTTEDEYLGKVHHLIETGSNDVLVVRATDASIDQRERLIPYLPDQVVRSVDLVGSRLVADWDPEFWRVWIGAVSLFPEMYAAVTDYGITGRAVRDGLLTFTAWNPREFTHDRHRTVDDRPYGGGPGMLMKIQPLRDAIHAARESAPGRACVVYLSPQGEQKATQKKSTREQPQIENN